MFFLNKHRVYHTCLKIRTQVGTFQPLFLVMFPSSFPFTKPFWLKDSLGVPRYTDPSWRPSLGRLLERRRFGAWRRRAWVLGCLFGKCFFLKILIRYFNNNNNDQIRKNTNYLKEKMKPGGLESLGCYYSTALLLVIFATVFPAASEES